MGEPGDIDPLLPLLHDRQPQVRAAAAQALGVLHAAQAVAALQELTLDPYLNVRRAAAGALQLVSDH